MLKNRAGIVACAMALSVSAVAASQAADLRSPGSGNHAAPVTSRNTFGNLGHEGSALPRHKQRAHRKAELADNSFANLGHEGSGLAASWEAASVRPWAN
jgi:hypothetical protein